VRVLVNAVSISEGGARVVLIRLLAAMQKLRPDIRWLVAAHADMAHEIPSSAGTVVMPVSVGESIPKLLLWYNVKLPSLARSWSADVLFSMTNYLPNRAVSCSTLLLEQHAGHFSDEFDRLTRQATASWIHRLFWRCKRAWVYRSVRNATRLTVQTQALANAIAERKLRARDDIAIVPHGPGWLAHADEAGSAQNGKKTQQTGQAQKNWKIGYITKFGVQKNFLTLFRALAKLNEKGRVCTLVLTLDGRHATTAAVLRNAAELGIGRCIENFGEVDPNDLTSLYDSLDIFVFPSTCESFGLPMVEAMARGLPLVVADTPENREVTGNLALYHAPYASEQLAEKLSALMGDRNLYEQQARKSLQRSREFSWEKAASATVALFDGMIPPPRERRT
jgi:glycosyltransferase involved in cell wall biosynthesis